MERKACGRTGKPGRPHEQQCLRMRRRLRRTWRKSWLILGEGSGHDVVDAGVQVGLKDCLEVATEAFGPNRSQPDKTRNFK